MGIVQGLTEFLPVSSSGHLVLAKELTNNLVLSKEFTKFAETDIFFDTILHVGTLFAVLVVLKKDVQDMIVHFFKALFKIKNIRDFKNLYREDIPFRLAILIILGTIPAIIFGFLLKDTFEKLFESALAVGIALSITGVFLLLTYFAPKPNKSAQKTTWFHCLIIGLAQAMAITPGISRSGATISAAIFLGIDRDLAGRFSFLLSIPAILGAVILQAGDVATSKLQNTEYIIYLIAGLLSSAAIGYIALQLLLKLVKQGRFFYFGFYCIFIGTAAIIWSILKG